MANKFEEVQKKKRVVILLKKGLLVLVCFVPLCFHVVCCGGLFNYILFEALYRSLIDNAFDLSYFTVLVIVGLTPITVLCFLYTKTVGKKFDFVVERLRINDPYKLFKFCIVGFSKFESEEVGSITYEEATWDMTKLSFVLSASGHGIAVVLHRWFGVFEIIWSHLVAMFFLELVITFFFQAFVMNLEILRVTYYGKDVFADPC